MQINRVENLLSGRSFFKKFILRKRKLQLSFCLPKIAYS